jgi:hypothetical protein
MIFNELAACVRIADIGGEERRALPFPARRPAPEGLPLPPVTMKYYLRRRWSGPGQSAADDYPHPR